MTVTQCVYAAIQWLREQLETRAPKPWWVLVPKPVPYVPLLVQRIDVCIRQPLSVFIACGMPFAGSPALARLRKLNGALCRNLSAHAVAALAPYLRRGVADGGKSPSSWLPRVSPERALLLLQASGACAEPSGPHRWHERMASLLERTTKGVAAAKQSTDMSERRQTAIRRQELERLAREVRVLLPSLRDLDDLAERFARGGTRQELLEHYWRFVDRWLVMPMTPPLQESVVRLCFTSAAASKERRSESAEEFVSWLEGTLQSLVLDVPHCAAPDITIALQRPIERSGSVFRMREGSDEAHFTSSSPTGVPLPPAAATSIAFDRAVAHPWVAGQRNLRDVVERVSAGSEEAGVCFVGPPGSVRWGLEPGRPLSATALALLLTCPYRFLLERVAHVHPLQRKASTKHFEASAFGTLVHEAFAAFLKWHGAAFFARNGTLRDWLECVRALVVEHFEARLRTYPLWGETNQAEELLRLQASLERLVAAEWKQPPREFLAVEYRFGEPSGVRLRGSRTPLYVRGSIDWLDRTARGLTVGELKTVAITVAEPTRLDFRRYLQLGVYVLAIESGALGNAETVSDAAVVMVNPSDVRRWQANGRSLQQVRERTAEAVEVATVLLQSAKFPRTPAVSDCMYCPFFTYCGEAAASDAVRASLETADEELQAFYTWRGVYREGLRTRDQRWVSG